MPDSGAEGVYNTLLKAGVCSSAAVIGRTVVAPFSVMKINTQVGVVGSRRGLYLHYRHLMLDGGPRSLFRGNATACMRLVPFTVAQVTVYDTIVKNLILNKSDDRVLDVWSLGVVYTAGATAGVVGTLLTHPLDVVKTRLSVNPVSGARSNYSDALDAFIKIFKQEGVAKGLYRGLIPSIMGSATYSALLFLCLDLVNNIPYRKRNAPGFIYFESLFWPIAAVGTATFAALPMDVLRKKVMASSDVLPKNGFVDVKFNSLPQLVYQVYSKNWLYGFYHGTIPCVMKIVPQVTIFVVVWNLFYRRKDTTAVRGSLFVQM